jgi:hypothetical protein
MLITILVISNGVFALAAAGLWAQLRWNFLPFPDRGFRIFTTPDQATLTAVVELLEYFGVKPRYEINSTDIQRVAMADGVTIINTSTPELSATMGNPTAGIALVVKDPQAAAYDAKALLDRQGYATKILGELDPDVPKGAMVFVSTEALPGVLLVFRRHVTKMGNRPSRYRRPYLSL